MRSDVATTPGWYGKLPALGDFASRRLQEDFIEPWDLWLAGAMQAQRAALGDTWLDAYRQSPPWRFLLTPGVIAGAAPGAVFAGVLVPSADRVGRHFPLTLAAELPAVPVATADVEALLGWLHRLEDTALDAVQGGWGIDDLEDALSMLPPPARQAASAGNDRLAAVRRALAAAQAGGGGFVDIEPDSNRVELAGVFAAALGAAPAAAPVMAGHLDRAAVFMADVPGRPRLLVSVGLPGRQDFGRMFSGGSVGASSPAPAAAMTTGIAAGVASAGLGASAIDLIDDALFAPLPSSPGLGAMPASTPLFAATAASTATTVPTSTAASTTDVLAMFDSEATVPPQQLTALASAPFASHPLTSMPLASMPLASTPLASPIPAAAPADPDDILALFATQPAAAPPSDRGDDGDGDILDLFGSPAVGSGPAKPR